MHRFDTGGDLRRALALLALPTRRVALAIVLGVLALGSALGLAALAAWLIARAWQMPPVLDLGVAVVAVRALGIARGLCRYLERLATHDVALRGMSSARVAVYRQLAGADNAVVTGLRRGDLLTGIGAEVDALGAVVVRVLVPIAVAAVTAVAAVGLLATISLTAAAILAGALALSGIVAPAMAARAAGDAERAVLAHRAERTVNAVAALDHAAELRVAGRLDAVLDAAAQAGRRAVAAEDRAARKGAWAAAATPLSVGASVLGSLLVGIVVYGGSTAHGMTPMALTILVLLPLSAFEAVAPLPAAAQALNQIRATVLRSERRRSRSHRAAEGGIGELPDRRRIAVVGPSGSGKTTLLMNWAGLLDGAGQASSRRTTFFAEDAHLFDTTILENLRVARGDLAEAEAVEALAAVGLGDWLRGLPDGVHTELIGGAAAVSGGQRRRILLARALVSPAEVLLLDEPTEHLDAEHGAELLRALLDPNSGLVAPDRTVVVVTHQLPKGLVPAGASLISL